jgi:membrane-bound lytic murein transglycosylase C
VPLAFAVIHTESYFNPKATSPAPAYGLMQLVPRSGARDAYRFVYGQDRILPPDYLYVPGNNVELGCAYLGLLKNRYFRNVKDPQNALYCAVASYNTGAGNLSRSLAGKARIQPAIDRVNTMNPEELYTHLRNNLPYAETRDYIKKVRERMRLYKEWE